jgi:hypothetical protein
LFLPERAVVAGLPLQQAWDFKVRFTELSPPAGIGATAGKPVARDRPSNQPREVSGTSWAIRADWNTRGLANAVRVARLENGRLGLAEELRASPPGVERPPAEALIAMAHGEICPHSRASRGDIAVRAAVE